jgi:hypothetical protein
LLSFRSFHGLSHTTTQQLPQILQLHSLLGPSHDRRPQLSTTLLGDQLQGVNDLAGRFKDPSILVRQPHDLECKNFKRRRGKRKAGEAANNPAPKAGCLTPHTFENGTPNFLPIPQSPERMRIQLTSHIHSALDLEGLLHQPGRRYRAAHVQNLGEGSSLLPTSKY